MDLPQIKACEGEEEQEYSSEPQNDYQRYCRNGSNKVHNHIAMRHTKRLVERFEQIKFGQSVGDVSEEQEHDIFNNLNSGKIALTNAELIKALFLNNHERKEVVCR